MDRPLIKKSRRRGTRIISFDVVIWSWREKLAKACAGWGRGPALKLKRWHKDSRNPA
jgi:hypothetical protein